MDFFEQLFGLALDNGNGALELLFFVIPIAGMVLLRIVRSRRRLAS